MSLRNNILGILGIYKNIHMCITHVYDIRRKAGMNELSGGEIQI